MMLKLHTLSQGTKRKRRKRRGRGNGSGRGTYSGRGIKGQRARSGGTKGLKRMGMKRMIQSLPKQGGFVSRYQKPATVSLGALDTAFAEGATITPALLWQRGFVHKSSRVKILTGGRLTKKFTIRGCSFSQAARKALLAAGGTIS